MKIIVLSMHNKKTRNQLLLAGTAKFIIFIIIFNKTYILQLAWTEHIGQKLEWLGSATCAHFESCWSIYMYRWNTDWITWERNGIGFGLKGGKGYNAWQPIYAIGPTRILIIKPSCYNLYNNTPWLWKQRSLGTSWVLVHDLWGTDLLQPNQGRILFYKSQMSWKSHCGKLPEFIYSLSHSNGKEGFREKRICSMSSLLPPNWIMRMVLSAISSDRNENQNSWDRISTGALSLTDISLLALKHSSLRSSWFLSFFRRHGDRTSEWKGGELSSTPGVSQKIGEK